MAATPSNVLHLTSQAMGEAQARLRGLAMESTNLDTIDALIEKRNAIDVQQRRIMRANLVIIDKDPAVLANIAELTQLTGELAAGVQEMRNATRALKAATSFITVAEKILTQFGVA